MAVKERSSFSITPEVKAELNKYIPKSARSKFIEEAIKQALKNKAKEFLLNSLKTMKTVPSNGIKTETALDEIRKKELSNLLNNNN